MALLNCKECDNQVSTKAKNCPKCGAKAPKEPPTLLQEILSLIVIIAIVAAVIHGCNASTPAPVKQTEQAQQDSDYLNNYIQYGFEMSREGNNIKIILDPNFIIANIPRFKEEGKLEYFADPDHLNLNSSPLTECMLIGLILISDFIKDYYNENPKINNLHFNVFMKQLDGHDNKSNEIYSFDFNREIYNRINWQNFNKLKLTRTSINFQDTKWSENILKKEDNAS